MEILAIKDLSFCYAGEDSPALSDINITVSQGDFTVLAGATGSGKSTLLRLIKRELAPRGVTAMRLLASGMSRSARRNRL